MGEAKRRKAMMDLLLLETQAWVSALPPVDREIASVGLSAHRRIVEDRGFVSGCYLLGFFLTEYLQREKGISVDLVVGYVNDGTSPIMASHAWIEHEGRKTDIALTLTEHADAQPPGELRILDRVIRPGKAVYTYHQEQSEESAAFVEALAKEYPHMAEAIRAKDKEHTHVESMSRSPELIRAFLDAAPPDRNYEAFSAIMRA